MMMLFNRLILHLKIDGVGGKAATTSYAQAYVEVKYVAGVVVIVDAGAVVVDHMWMSKLLCAAVQIRQ